MHLKFIADNINAVQSVIQNSTWIHFLTAYHSHYINLYSLTCYYNEIKFGYILPEKTIHDNKKTVLCSVTCQTEFTPLTYVYYSEKRNWNDASQTCAQTDGMLARFPDVSTVMDILEELPAIK